MSCSVICLCIYLHIFSLFTCIYSYVFICIFYSYMSTRGRKSPIFVSRSFGFRHFNTQARNTIAVFALSAFAESRKKLLVQFSLTTCIHHERLLQRFRD